MLAASSQSQDETSPAKEAASALASTTTSVVARALPPGKPPYWSPDHSNEDEVIDASAGEVDEGSSLNVDDSQPHRSPTTPRAPPVLDGTKLPPVTAQPPSPATTTAPSAPGSSKQMIPARLLPAKGKSPATGAGKPSSSSKKVSLRSTKSSTAAGSVSRSSSSNHKVAKTPSKAKTKAKAQAPSKVALSAAPYHIDIKTSVARAAQCARMDSRESDHMKQQRGLPFFHPGARRCWDQMLALNVPCETTSEGERVRPTPTSAAGIQAFADITAVDHPWRQTLHLLPDHMFFVDDSILEICPPVEKGKRAKKPATDIEVLSNEWCKYRAIGREDIFLALWERSHWLSKSSILISLAEEWQASDQSNPVVVEAAVREEPEMTEPHIPGLHPKTGDLLNRPGISSFSPPNLAHGEGHVT
ncbi:hypothetical protein PHYBOEH_008956 [Phytophthora boehmeriae]|uniref:Uncharacterized protein n=1 Tax=Phytophthora boehmeriae TaxID=109152 RepID=A0A8T1VXQ6_9STRA|nr:hypothetical protein PHYBOEH_008956 [Phytophthora boehmeriae]